MNPYFQMTSRDYEVSGPNSDGNLKLFRDDYNCSLWLSKADLLMMLARFETANEVEQP